MDWDLEKELDRTGTNSIKWEFAFEEGALIEWDRTHASHGDDRVLPLWVADMDFPAAPPIQAAIRKRAEHGVFGYASKGKRYLSAVAGWMQRRHGFLVEQEWIVPTPGVVPGLHLCVRRFTKPGDKILIQPPVYHPFRYSIERNQRVVAANPLILDNGRYQMDFAQLEQTCQDPEVKLAILCSPHNPVGRVWSTDELTRFAEICTRHDVLVMADEIHGDLIMPGHKFVSYGSLDESLTENVIVGTAPSKSFNLAGLQTANLIIRNQTLREELRAEMAATGLFTVNPFGIVATEAAYNEGEPWLAAVISHIDANLDLLEAYVSEHIPPLKVIRPEGTYLAWVDCRALGLAGDALHSLMMDKAKIYLDRGDVFGPEGEGFMRFNVACSRSILEQALSRVRREVDQLNA